MTIKTLKEFLLETTVPPKYQHVAQDWDHLSQVDAATHEKMQKALDRGNFTTFPLDNLGEGDPDVVEHLVNHGWDVKDYQKGIAQKKIQVGNPERGIPIREKIVEKKIGSILDETNASDDVKKTFTNQRGQSNADEYHVCVSNSPLSILGMSTGTSWDSQSCMRYPEGLNNHYLEQDSKHGTHVAYLVHSSDKGAFEHGEPDKPIARIALKPHHYETSDGGRDTIFRPELRTYGAGSTAFSNSVSNWAVKNYPAIKNVTYNKNDYVYDDTGNNAYQSIGEEEIKKRIDDNDSGIVDPGATIDNHVIDAGLEHFKKRLSEMSEGEDKAEYAYRIARKFNAIGNLSPTHVSKILKHITDRNDEFVTRDAYRNIGMMHGDKFSTNAINEYLKHKFPYDSIHAKVLASPKLPDSVIDDLDPQKYIFVRQSKIKSHHIDKLINEYNNDLGYLYNANTLIARFKNKFSEEHISKLIKHAEDNGKKDWVAVDKLNQVIPTIANSDNFTKDHHRRLVAFGTNSGSQDFMENVIRNSKYTSVNDFPKYRGNIMSRLIEHQNLSEDSTKELKNHFVDTAEKVRSAYDSMGRNEDILTQSLVGTDYDNLPEKFTNHFTESDYHRLANSGLVLNFESPEHSNKYLDAIHQNIKKHDQAYLESPTQENANELNKHITRFGSQLAEHVNDHVYHGSRTVKNAQEFENVYQRLRGDSNDERSITSMKSTLNPYGNSSLTYAMNRIPQKMQPVNPK
jgi:hypothetical protein